jgi:RimJ/RimL family protein N-acetyltransferase
MTVLQSQLVLLRPIRRSDIVRQREFSCDRELAWLDSNSPGDYEHIVERFLCSQPETTTRFSIEVDSEYIGYCSLTKTASSESVFELGINIGDRRYWGRGMGREVVRLLLEHGFSEFGATAIELTTNGKNERAIRCFTATGFTEQRRVKNAILYDEEHVDMIEMSIDREVWQARLAR